MYERKCGDPILKGYFDRIYGYRDSSLWQNPEYRLGWDMAKKVSHPYYKGW